MNKKLFLSLATVLACLGLASCGNGDGPGKVPELGKPGEFEKTFWDTDGNGYEDWTEKEITLKYASWQHNSNEAVTIESLMVQEFTKKYPNVKVEMQLVGESTEWDENMLGLLETNNVPDVFLVNRLENFLPVGLMADITDCFDNDPDTEYIFDSVRNLGVYKNKRYVIPTYIYPQFWIVNKDLIQEANQSLPGYDWTWEMMENLAKSVHNDTTHKIGLYGTAQYFYEYPKVIESKTNPDNGWYAYGYNGEKFDFSSQSYLTAMNNMEVAIQQGYLVNALSPEQCLEYYGNAETDPRYSGNVAIWREASWSVKDRIPDFGFEFDIYPAPSGIGMGNTDIAGVSALSKNKLAAYQLLKWMSYSEEGILRRFELYEEYKDELYISGNNYPYPVVQYPDDPKTGINAIWSAIPYGSTAPGLVSPEFTEALRKGAIQANKEVVGWDAVDEAVGQYFAQILNGENDFASLVEAIQNDANKALSDARKKMDKVLG